MFFCVRHASRADFSISCGWRGRCKLPRWMNQDGWKSCLEYFVLHTWDPRLFFVHLCALFVSCLPRILFVVLILVNWCAEHLGEVFDLKLSRKSVAPSQYRHHLLKECNAHATTTRCTCQVKTIHLKPGLLSLQWLRLRKDFTKHKENGGKTPRMGATKNHQRYLHLI